MASRKGSKGGAKKARRSSGVTSPRVAKLASKGLRSKKTSKAQKSVDASALRQARGKKSSAKKAGKKRAAKKRAGKKKS